MDDTLNPKSRTDHVGRGRAVDAACRPVGVDGVGDRDAVRERERERERESERARERLDQAQTLGYVWGM